MVSTTDDSTAPVDILNKIISFSVRLLGFQHKLDLKIMYAAFVETLLACAGSCFPGLENDIKDEYDGTSTEQKKIKQN